MIFFMSAVGLFLVVKVGLDALIPIVSWMVRGACAVFLYGKLCALDWCKRNGHRFPPPAVRAANIVLALVDYARDSPGVPTVQSALFMPELPEDDPTEWPMALDFPWTNATATRRCIAWSTDLFQFWLHLAGEWDPKHETFTFWVPTQQPPWSSHALVAKLQWDSQSFTLKVFPAAGLFQVDDDVYETEFNNVVLSYDADIRSRLSNHAG